MSVLYSMLKPIVRKVHISHEIQAKFRFYLPQKNVNTEEISFVFFFCQERNLIVRWSIFLS